MSENIDWRKRDRTVFLVVAVLFPLAVVIGFGPTYYLRFAFDRPPLPTLLVHVHGLVMTIWVLFFITQVFLIRTRNHKAHMSFGMIGIALAIIVLLVGFFTAASAAKFGSPSSPPDIPPLAFFTVPLTDLLMFAGLFGAAIYFRKRPAVHKRLMLLTVVNFLPPAIARIPVPALQSAGPLLFFGVPVLVLIAFLIFDTRANGKLNKPLLLGSLALIISYPLRIMIGMTSAWLAFAAWITSWAA